ncbi:Cbb3-type cytochrome c oxidase subunit CcoP [uncultured Gammaproteobacteria bacterium]
MAGNVERDPLTGVETTGHEWDGIKELNNPLPSWWLYIYFACILWSVIYWVLYPAWPVGTTYTKGILGWSQRMQVEDEIKEAKAAQSKFTDQIAKLPLAQIKTNKELYDFAVTGGRSVFAGNCVQCHGAGGQGRPGFPNLADDEWLHGGSLDDIFKTVQHGVRATNDNDTRQPPAMPSFGKDGTLNQAQIGDAAEFVRSLNKVAGTDAEAAKRGAAVFADNCASCHGEKGEGNPDLGSKPLNDGIWLYGGDKATIVQTLTNGRAGVMPSWATRLDDTSIKEVALYVHGLGGGK